MTRMAINRLGRIGRAAFKQIVEENEWGYTAQLKRQAKAVTRTA